MSKRIPKVGRCQIEVGPSEYGLDERVNDFLRRVWHALSISCVERPERLGETDGDEDQKGEENRLG